MVCLGVNGWKLNYGLEHDATCGATRRWPSTLIVNSNHYTVFESSWSGVVHLSRNVHLTRVKPALSTVK